MPTVKWILTQLTVSWEFKNTMNSFYSWISSTRWCSISPGEVLAYEAQYWNIQNVLWSIKKIKRRREVTHNIITCTMSICFYVLYISSFSYFFCNLRVKFAGGSRALLVHVSLFLCTDYICSLCPTGIQLGFSLQRTIRREGGTEWQDRGRQWEDEELKCMKRKENNFCFHKLHLSCTKSQKSVR